jgi:hypothetical protein
MKNIHLLPTDKPSRLFVDIDDNKLKITQPLSGEYMMNQNIYITSDEEIKEGDYRYSGVQNNIELVTEFSLKVNKEYWKINPHLYKKIILTTDGDLIKDGVQAIDDKFLEWFVNNPNCEEVEIKTRYLHSYKTGENFISFSKTPEFSSRNMQCIKIEPRYEIIIPQ